jgi:hypothetical protein
LAKRRAFPKGGDESLTVLDANSRRSGKKLGQTTLGSEIEPHCNRAAGTAPVRVCKTSRNAITAS